MRVHVFREAGLLPSVHDVKAFTPKGDRVIVARDGDVTAQHPRLGVKVVTVVRRNQVRLHAAVHDPIAITTQFRFKFGFVHCLTPCFGSRICALWRTCCQL
jgi:hypothetical protein